MNDEPSKTPNVDRLLQEEREALSKLPDYLQPAWLLAEREAK